jgi:hypothetical protein
VPNLAADTIVAPESFSDRSAVAVNAPTLLQWRPLAREAGRLKTDSMSGSATIVIDQNRPFDQGRVA